MSQSDAGTGDAVIGCEEALSQLYEYLDGELSADWDAKVRSHVERCKRCYPYFNFERVFLDHIRSLRLAPETSERLERRIRDALEDADEV